MFKLTTESTMTNFHFSQDQKHGVQRLTNDYSKDQITTIITIVRE